MSTLMKTKVSGYAMCVAMLVCGGSMAAERGTAVGRRKTSRAVRWTLVGLMVIHAGLLGWSAYRDSPTWDEAGHFAAGLSHWGSGTFRLCI
jgi:hypothetical protein